MAGPSPNKNELVLGLTPSEAKVLILSILCNNDGKVDFNLLAQKGGYKTKDSANVVFGNARRKLLRLHGENSTAGTTGEPSAFMTPATDAAGTKGKNLGGTEGEDGASLSGPGPATPASKKATPKRKKAAAADTEETTGDSLPTDGQWNNLDETPTPTPKRQRKKGTAVKVATPKKMAKSPKVKSEETAKEDPEEKVDDTCPQTDLKMDTEDRALSLDIERFVNREKD
ncbi:histone h1.3 [Paecilomyces variotii No. 5]|uniref:Histone h1.3 n=1 Tax=Byssochlamys spectabilis (strain No. 5 / NBRC 109023) TaxID=1356009 RepID=V5FPX6_BYSSN|nr:histone h1.3 [Paecilomyces variotii No. 5]